MRSKLLLLLSAIPLGANAVAANSGSIYRKPDLGMIVETQRTRLPRFGEILSRLELKPGMFVVDIGAGTGQLSYAIASQLKGSGKIYATDIDPMLVAYISSQAQVQGLSNLESVLVAPEGLDPFYESHRFDLAILFNTDTYIRNRPAYYRKLRNRINPHGRLVVIESEATINRYFFPEDIKDWKGLVEAAKNESPYGPFGKFFRQPMAQMLLQYGADDPILRRMMLFHMNRLLEFRFFLQFTNNLQFHSNVAFTKQEAPMASWMLHRLALDGALENDLAEVDVRRYRQMQLLNRLLIIQHYRAYLADESPEPYYSSAPESMWYIRHDLRVHELESAGYQLVSKWPLVPFWEIWTFEPKRGLDMSEE